MEREDGRVGELTEIVGKERWVRRQPCEHPYFGKNDKCASRWKDGWMDGWMDGWIRRNGWTRIKK